MRREEKRGRGTGTHASESGTISADHHVINLTSQPHLINFIYPPLSITQSTTITDRIPTPIPLTNRSASPPIAQNGHLPGPKASKDLALRTHLLARRPRTRGTRPSCPRSRRRILHRHRLRRKRHETRALPHRRQEPRRRFQPPSSRTTDPQARRPSHLPNE